MKSQYKSPYKPAHPLPTRSLILASASPRRAELLQQVGVSFTVRTANIDESRRGQETAADYVQRLARSKALAVAQTLTAHEQGQVILAADTTVAIGEHILEKPRDEADFSRMMHLLSGTWHEVLTGVAVWCEGELQSQVVTTRVRFMHLSEDDIRRYWATVEPCDKAGGYAIQGRGAAFIPEIQGSYSNVVGLPLVETLGLLAAHDLSR